MATGVLSIFWFAGSCAWAQGVTDIKYYTNPTNLFQDIDICQEPKVCHTVSPGNFASLNVSLVRITFHSLMAVVEWCYLRVNVSVCIL